MSKLALYLCYICLFKSLDYNEWLDFESVVLESSKIKLKKYVIFLFSSCNLVVDQNIYLFSIAIGGLWSGLVWTRLQNQSFLFGFVFDELNEWVVGDKTLANVRLVN